MSDSQHERLRRLFDEALDLSSASRALFLDRECGRDVALKQRLARMLAAAEGGDFLSSPTGPAPVALRPDASEALGAAPLREGPGTRIGLYTIVKQIGEGGFGSVFLAEQ